MNSISYKDIIYSTTANSLDYVIKLDGDVIFRGGAVKSPKKASIELNVSKIIRNYIQENFADIRDFTGSTFEEPGAFGVFELYKLTTEYDAVEHTNYTVETLLETYNILLGFDYQGEWNGEACIMTRPVNGHIDPRMKIFCTQYSPVSTSIVIDSEQPVPPPSPYLREYLTFDIISSGTITLDFADYSAGASPLSLTYSKNNGTWNTGTFGSTTISVSAGDRVRFKGNNSAYSWVGEQGTVGNLVYNQFKSTAKCNIYGNIMSLVYGDNFIGNTDISNRAFSSLFFDSSIISAENLMLPSTTLANSCYDGMFLNCTHLTTAPELPASTLAYGCYYDMFNGCNSLQTPPELPATTLAISCYIGMFRGCTSLKTSPVLPATALTNSCYYFMFSGCTSLNYVKCLAETFEVSIPTEHWLEGVSATGTFVKKAGITWLSGEDGIPSGWTVQEE